MFLQNVGELLTGTWRKIPKDSTPHSYRFENIKLQNFADIWQNCVDRRKVSTFTGSDTHKRQTQILAPREIRTQTPLFGRQERVNAVGFGRFTLEKESSRYALDSIWEDRRSRLDEVMREMFLRQWGSNIVRPSQLSSKGIRKEHNNVCLLVGLIHVCETRLYSTPDEHSELLGLKALSIIR